MDRHLRHVLLFLRGDIGRVRSNLLPPEENQKMGRQQEAGSRHSMIAFREKNKICLFYIRYVFIRLRDSYYSL